MDGEEYVELTIRLPARVVDRIETLTPGSRLPDLLKEGIASMLAAAEARAVAAEAGDPPGAAPSLPAGTTPEAEPEAAVTPAGEGPAPMPVMAVGDAALVLERLARLEALLAPLRDQGARNEVWAKTLLAELFTHLTPFRTPAEEHERRAAAAERLGRVDARVAAWVARPPKAADGAAGGSIPGTS